MRDKPVSGMVRRAILVAAIAQLTLPANGQEAHSDFQSWPSVRMSAATDRLEFSGDAILLLARDSSQFDQLLVRGVLSYRLTEALSAGAGFAYTTFNDGLGLRQTEHRTVQDLTYRPFRADDAVSVTLRLRAEERFRHAQDSVAVRLRQLARIDFPLHSIGSGAVVWNETFYALNSTHWSGAAGIPLSLSFVGFNVPVSNKVTVEPGYLNFRLFGAGQDRIRHVLSISLHIRV